MLFLIEDDGFKEEAVKDAISEFSSPAETLCERSVQTAILRLSEGPFELIIVDMALPSHDRTRGVGNPTSMPSGGVEIILELNRLRRRDPVLILTQYPEVEIWGELVKLANVIDRLKIEVDINIVGIVQFDQTKNGWRSAIRSIVEGVL